MTEPLFFEEAAAEIEHERWWYGQRSAAAQAAFLRELDRAIDSVTTAPERWPREIAGTRRYVLPKFPFSLIYFEENGRVVVVALASERKRPGYWLERMEKE